MKKYFLLILLSLVCLSSSATTDPLKGKRILYIEREQYAPDHHNTETLFQTEEINTNKFVGGSSLNIFDCDSKKITTILKSENGVIRDAELSYDGDFIIFSLRNDVNDDYHIYEISIDGTGLRQLTFGSGISDIDPIYLPNGDIIFSSSRQPKYCMCNRNIMCNLHRMDHDGKNIRQLGYNTLFDGHPSIMDNGLILYDRWEYVDRNFGDAQGLWTVNPDGTKHSIYYGNNMCSPGAIIDARQIPGTDLVVCIFSSCHDRPWGALAVLDRKQGVDGGSSVKFIEPSDSREYIQKGDWDAYKRIDVRYEDPMPLDSNTFLVSKTTTKDFNKSAIYLVKTDGTNQLIIEGEKSLFDPQVIQSRQRPILIPSTIENTNEDTGIFYVQNVYEGTHMKGVLPGQVKYIRVIETPEKRTWTTGCWYGQGEQAPGINWSSFEVKRIIGEAEVGEDGSVCFKAPAKKFLYFQLLDKDKKMIQSMRSGTMLLPGEINGCIGCHEDRLSAPRLSTTMKIKPQELTLWNNKEPHNFSYMEEVQPILDRNCVRCHDFDQHNREKLVLARDKNMFFNASYINLYVRKIVSLVGGGPADIQEAYSWGTHASKLTSIIDTTHHGVMMNESEKKILYTWMDLNGVYYPTYETSFADHLGGRSPLSNAEIEKLSSLTSVDFKALNGHNRKLDAQLSFDRPKLSPCLDKIRDDKKAFNEAVRIIKQGSKVLKSEPRGDIENQLYIHPKLQLQLNHYNRIISAEQQQQ